MPKNSCTALISYEEDLPTAFKSAFDVTKDVLSSKCPRCESSIAPKQWFITCVQGCCSCDQCPVIFGDESFWYKTKKGGVISCYNTCNRACQGEALAQPVVNKAYAAAKVALEEVDTALKHGVSLIKEQGYVTSAMEQGEEAPEWVPIPPKQAMFKAKAALASEVQKMKSEGKSAKAIQAFICGDEEEAEEEAEEEEESEEPAPKRARKEPTAEQLARREARKEETRMKKVEDKRKLGEYPELKEKCTKMRLIIRGARVELLTEKDPDEVNAILGEESDDESDDECNYAKMPVGDSDEE